MVSLKKTFILMFSILLYANCYAFEKVFYILHGKTPTELIATQSELVTLKPYTKLIDILISQAYQINATGAVEGYVDSSVLNFAKQNSIKLMPLVTNHEFNTEIAHQFLLNLNAQNKAIDLILAECQKYQYYGVQLDFEMIHITDRNLLTRFYQLAAERLHKAGYIVSFTVSPEVSNGTEASYFLTKIWKNWEGAYNLKQLGEAADFLTVMTYDQHGQGTTPGPPASYPWTEEAVKHALKYVPANKISLGIPTESTYWYTGQNPETRSLSILVNTLDHNATVDLINKYKINLQWDDKNKFNYAIFDRNWLFEYLFVENAKSFAAKIELVKKYKLRGISVFVLGTEDPQIWKVLQSQ